MPRLTLLGTGSIVPTVERFASSILLQTDENTSMLLDCGPGTLEKLRRINMHPIELASVLITHFHLDHFSDIPPLIMVRAYDKEGNPATQPPLLKIIGPRGIAGLIKTLTKDIQAFSYLSNNMRCDRYLDVVEVWEDSLAVGNTVVRTVPVEHYDGVAYRVEVNGVSIVYSGDTIPDERLVKLASKCDMLIHECSFPHEKLVGKHTSDKQLVEIVKEAQPRRLLITHLYPAWRGKEEELKKKIQEETNTEVIIGYDFLTVQL